MTPAPPNQKSSWPPPAAFDNLPHLARLSNRARPFPRVPRVAAAPPERPLARARAHAAEGLQPPQGDQPPEPPRSSIQGDKLLPKTRTPWMHQLDPAAAPSSLLWSSSPELHQRATVKPPCVGPHARACEVMCPSASPWPRR